MTMVGESELPKKGFVTIPHGQKPATSTSSSSQTPQHWPDPLPTHLLASQNVHAMPRWCKLHVKIDVKQIFSLVSGVDSFGVPFLCTFGCSMSVAKRRPIFFPKHEQDWGMVCRTEKKL